MVAQVHDATRKPQFTISYYGTDIAASATGTLTRLGAAVTSWRAPYAGSVYALAMGITGTLTSGSMTVTPMVNTTPKPAFALTLNTAEATSAATTQEGRKTTFAAGDTLSLLYTAAGNFLPDGSMDILVDCYVMLEGVEL